MTLRLVVTAIAAAAISVSAQARPVAIEDLLKTRSVSSPSISPDGSKVVYAVSSVDLEEDKNTTHVWIANIDGSGERQLTMRDGENESSPKFSPDGSMIGFLSSRGDEDDDALTRLWLLPLNGGEARPVEGIEGSVSDFVWSPDGSRMALVIEDPEPQDEEADNKDDERPKPIVIDRYRFKEDYTGYLDNRRERLWLFDPATGALERLADGDFDEGYPSFSPDGRQVAFVSNRTAEPDRNSNTDVWVASLTSPGAAPRQLTVHPGADSENSYPAWSPDGSRIAYVHGADPAKIWYGVLPLAVVPAAGGEPVILTPSLDRNVSDPLWTEDGQAVRMIVEDDGRQYLAEVPATGGTVTQLATGNFVLRSPTSMHGGKMALLSSTNFSPNEVFAFADGMLTKVTAQNDEWLAGIDFGSVSMASYASEDGTEVHGLIYLPPGHDARRAQPTTLMLHGGPASQFDYSWDTEPLWQVAAGYVVLAPNPRGSTGRGDAYAMAGHSRWGDLDVGDVLAAVDDGVARGIADPERLGVGGWSYGGMLTNYVIASDTRFKAAVSGASISNIFTGFGHDQYIREYIAEIGTPWENFEGWMAISYPFFQNQRIVTPTLFIVGEEDVNVPTIASEQMYQALRYRGVDTQLVIYPGEYHGIRRPSFLLDRMQRWNAWLDKYLKN